MFSPLHVNCIGMVFPGGKAVVFSSSFAAESLATESPAARKMAAAAKIRLVMLLVYNEWRQPGALRAR
ncbi:MAG: hypothetical protein P4N24_12590 [Acidobacteriota bacterium]|nr:hypothetical protein [Acidobacteriota bacterium]